jgi:hypothetical protein
MKTTRSSLVALAAALGVAFPAHAQQPDPKPTGEVTGAEGEKPWSVGVSQEDKDKARELLKAGNARVYDGATNDAIALYREALTHWEHPLIHYNLALALLKVAEPLEIYQAFEAALKWDRLGFQEEESYETAVRYRDLFAQQVVWIKVKCNETGAKLTIDGKDVGACPTDATDAQLMRAGEHSFTATKAGFETAAVNKVYPGGDNDEITLKLYRPEDLTQYKRRLAPWIPWAVTGGGLGVTVIAGILHATASSDIKEFDRQIADCGGCTPTQAQKDLKSGAETKQSIALGGYVIGGAALVAGIALLVINRPQPYRISEEEPAAGTAVVPIIGHDRVGVSATFSF